MNYLFFSVVGYLSGSIMYAYWLPKWFKHIDVCEVSDDSNPGTANAFKHAGIGVGCLVVFCELFKGIVPIWIALRHLDVFNWLFLPVLLAPVLGHAFPIFMKGKGGKAIAVSFGVLLGFFPHIDYALALAVFYLLFSLIFVVEPHLYRSIYTFACFSIAVLFHTSNLVISIGCVLISLIVVIKHLEKFHGEKVNIYFGIWNKAKKSLKVKIPEETVREEKKL